MAVHLPAQKRNATIAFLLGAFVAMAFATLACATSASADGLQLDDGFGASGISTFDGGTGARPRAIASDGDVTYVAIALNDGSPRTGVAKLDIHGNLDPSFGSQGIASPSTGVPTAIDIDPSGRVVLAAQDVVDPSYTMVERLDASGNLDPSFGDGGILYARVSGTPTGTGAVAMDVDAQGAIVLAATGSDPSSPANGTDVFTLRLTADGKEDIRRSAGGGVDDTATDVAFLGDGSTCVSGNYSRSESGSSPDPIGFFKCVGDPGSIVTYRGSEAIGVARIGGGAIVAGNGSAGTAFASDTGPGISSFPGLTAISVAPLGGRFAIGGSTNGVPSLVVGDNAHPSATGSIELPCGPGRILDEAADSERRVLALLDTDSAPADSISVARIDSGNDPAPCEIRDPSPPPDTTGKLRLGKLKVPDTFRKLVKRGGNVDTTCSRVCDVRLALVVPKRIARRYDLPGRRITHYDERLGEKETNVAHLPVHGTTSGRLLLAPDTPTRKLHLRVVVRSVSYLP